MKRPYWLLFFVLFMAAACAGPTAVEPSAAVDEAPLAVAEEQSVYANEAANFTIALSSDWLIAEATAEALTQMRSQNSALSFLTDDFAQALIASGLELYALNEAANSPDSVVPVSLKVIRQQAPTSLSLDELVTDTTNQLGNIVALTSEIERATVMLGSDEAVQISYSMQVKTAAGSEAEVHNTQYYLINDGDFYIVTLEMGQELVGAYLESSRAAAETFQLTGN